MNDDSWPRLVVGSIYANDPVSPFDGGDCNIRVGEGQYCARDAADASAVMPHKSEAASGGP